MNEIERLFRPGVLELKPYTSARDDFSGEALVFLDANENSFGSALGPSYSRYPDPHHRLLKQKLSEMKGVSPESVFVGNGSDEAIDLLIRAFCAPGRDSIIITPPTYGIYAVSAGINGVACKSAPLGSEFELDLEACRSVFEEGSKIIFLCSPNNPTGNSLKREAIQSLLKSFDGVVVLDEAYIDFSEQPSFLLELGNYRNLVVLQTLSKAWGLAGIRVGMAFADPAIVRVLEGIKATYNVSSLAQEWALRALAKEARKEELVKALVAERHRLAEALKQVPEVDKVFPSDANFLLVRFNDAKRIFQGLLDRGIVVRDRSDMPGCENCLRISVGLPDENRELLAALEELGGRCPLRGQEPRASERTAIVLRHTQETWIRVKINLDGSGRARIQSGLGFLNHMLEQLSRHSGFDLSVEVSGDLHVDEHHTVEDTALALGEAFAQALGDKRGIERFGFVVPMDDALAQVALDLSGRPWLVWELKFGREMIGDVPTEMFSHFFRSFCDSAKCTLNIKADGQNDHHKIESVFKACGKALGMAAQRRHGASEIPSTKGVL